MVFPLEGGDAGRVHSRGIGLCHESWNHNQPQPLSGDGRFCRYCMQSAHAKTSPASKCGIVGQEQIQRVRVAGEARRGNCRLACVSLHGDKHGSRRLLSKCATTEPLQWMHRPYMLARSDDACLRFLHHEPYLILVVFWLGSGMHLPKVRQ
jgi:hypothetical protein